MNSEQSSESSHDLPITHSPAVAVGRFNDGLTGIWTGFVMNLAGFYPMIVFLTTLDEPSYLKTVISWLIVSLPLLIGVICGAFGIKEKGYQKQSLRVFGIVSLCFGLACLMLPMLTSAIYLSGISR